MEGGTLLVAPDYQDHGTLLVSGETENPAWTGAGSLELSGGGFMSGGLVHGEGLIYFKGNPLSGDGHQMVMDQPTGVPEAWMRGGALELSGGQLTANNLIAVPDQVVASITTLASSGGSLSIGDRVLGEGTHNFNAEAAMDSQSYAVANVAAPAETHTAAAKHEAHTAEAHGTASIQFSVTPIVSGSDSPIDAQEGHDLSHGQAASPLVGLHTPTHTSVDLPILINSQEIQDLDSGADHEAGITFVDDDTYVAPADSPLDAVSAGVPASATHDVAAAVGGAFVAGSATQVAPAAKGLLPRKSLIA